FIERARQHSFPRIGPVRASDKALTSLALDKRQCASLMEGVPSILPVRGERAGSGSSDDYSLNRAARAGMSRQLRIADIENKSRLPCGVCGDFVEQRGARGRSAQRPLMVHHFHGLVTGARGKSVGSREEMGALPDSACLQALFLGVSVTHGDESDQRRA